MRTTRLQDFDHRSLGKWLERSIDAETTDVFDGLDGLGPAAGRRMQRYGKTWVCSRLSSHILTQKRLLQEECEQWGAPPPVFSASLLDRCLAEYDGADAIVVPSRFAQRSFLENGHHAKRIFVQPLGVDLSAFHRGTQQDSVFRVVFVGQASIRKGIGHLLEAVRPLVAAGKCETWLIGTIAPEVRPILEKYRDSFQHLGPLPMSELWQYYSQCSVLVLPSIEDGFGLVLAQAMACGVPVIATTNTGAEDLFTDGVEGFIVPIRDPNAIRTRLVWMMSNPALCKSMAEAALQRVQSLGGWGRHGKSCLAMYRELIRAKR